MTAIEDANYRLLVAQRAMTTAERKFAQVNAQNRKAVKSLPPKSSSSTWLAPPERTLKEVELPSAQCGVETLKRAMLEEGLSALQSVDAQRLVMPPLHAAPPQHLSARGHFKGSLQRHPYVEIGILCEGDMGMWWEGSVTLCPAQSVIVIPPATYHLPHVAPSEKSAATHTVVWLALHRSSAVVHACRLDGRTHFMGDYYSFPDAEVATFAQSIARELAERSDHYATAVRGSLLCLLVRLSRAPAYPVAHAYAPDPLRKVANRDAFAARVQEYLLSHYHHALTLEDVARALGCSRAHLCRKFQQATQQTPFQFLLNMRIEAAKRLLNAGAPIARVAEMVGFNDPLYFSKVFTAQVGEPPSRYRARSHGQ